MRINRRNFLSLGASAIAAQALGELKVFESDIPNEPVLKIKPLEIRLGLAKPFKALHISDTHINFFDAVDFAAVDKAKQSHFHRRWVRFPQAVQSFYASLDYARLHKLPILHTGDLVDFVTDGNERFLAHNLGGLDLHYAIGNHEYQSRAPEHYDSNPEGMRNRLCRHFPGNDLTVSSRQIGGANFVAFDNARLNLREETIARVKAEFDKQLPVVLMCHVPPIYTDKFLDNGLEGMYRLSRCMGNPQPPGNYARGKNVWNHYDQRTRDFYTWLQARPQLKAILCGHTHIAESDAFSETCDMFVAGGNYEGQGYEITFV